jgi:hypothetical protein
VSVDLNRNHSRVGQRANRAGAVSIGITWMGVRYRNKTDEQDEQNAKHRAGTTCHGEGGRLCSPDHVVIQIILNSTMMHALVDLLREITKGLDP